MITRTASRIPLSTVSAPLSPSILDAAHPDNEAFAIVYGGGGFHLFPVNKGRSGDLNRGMRISYEEEFSPTGYVLSYRCRLIIGGYID